MLILFSNSKPYIGPILAMCWPYMDLGGAASLGKHPVLIFPSMRVDTGTGRQLPWPWPQPWLWPCGHGYGDSHSHGRGHGYGHGHGHGHDHGQGHGHGHDHFHLEVVPTEQVQREQREGSYQQNRSSLNGVPWGHVLSQIFFTKKILTLYRAPKVVKLSLAAILKHDFMMKIADVNVSIMLNNNTGFHGSTKEKKATRYV